MPSASSLGFRALLACAGLLASGLALAHGVHDLRGRWERGAGRLVIDLAPTPGHAEPGRCLRLLDELEVRVAGGRRLTGTQAEDPDTGGCRLVYESPDEAATLLLRLRPPRRGPARHERLVLQEGERWEPLVVSNRGDPLRVPPR